MDSEKYDIIFLNFVLHWIHNKQDAFKNMFSSLKAGGKIAIQYEESLPPFMASTLEELASPEIEEQHNNMYHSVASVDVNCVCTKVGFNVVKSYHTNDMPLVWESMEGYLKWFWATTHGVFDPQAVTQEQIQRFLSRVGNPPFDFSAEYFDIRLTAVKA
ncbi:hypothetical protein ACROYT_G038559 [Oculina patagonica]